MTNFNNIYIVNKAENTTTGKYLRYVINYKKKKLCYSELHVLYIYVGYDVHVLHYQ